MVFIIDKEEYLIYTDSKDLLRYNMTKVSFEELNSTEKSLLALSGLIFSPIYPRLEYLHSAVSGDILLSAVSAGYKNLVNYILDSIHLSIGIVDASTGANPLHIAADKGYKDIISILTERCSFYLYGETNCGDLPIYLAAKNGNFDCMYMLMDKMEFVDDLRLKTCIKESLCFCVDSIVEFDDLNIRSEEAKRELKKFKTQELNFKISKISLADLPSKSFVDYCTKSRGAYLGI